MPKRFAHRWEAKVIEVRTQSDWDAIGHTIASEVKVRGEVMISRPVIVVHGGQIDIDSNSQINIQSGGQIDIHSGGKLYVYARGWINILADGKIEIRSGGLLSLLADSRLNLLVYGKIYIFYYGHLDFRRGCLVNIQYGGQINSISSPSDSAIERA